MIRLQQISATPHLKDAVQALRDRDIRGADAKLGKAGDAYLGMALAYARTGTDVGRVYRDTEIGIRNVALGLRIAADRIEGRQEMFINGDRASVAFEGGLAAAEGLIGKGEKVGLGDLLFAATGKLPHVTAGNHEIDAMLRVAAGDTRGSAHLLVIAGAHYSQAAEVMAERVRMDSDGAAAGAIALFGNGVTQAMADAAVMHQRDHMFGCLLRDKAMQLMVVANGMWRMGGDEERKAVARFVEQSVMFANAIA